MFFNEKEDDRTVINIPCSCGTHSIQVEYFDNTIEDVFLSFYLDKFYCQEGVFKTIWKRIKVAFLILCGKKYRFEEIVLNKEDVKKLEQGLHNILKSRKDENNEQK